MIDDDASLRVVIVILYDTMKLEVDARRAIRINLTLPQLIGGFESRWAIMKVCHNISCA